MSSDLRMLTWTALPLAALTLGSCADSPASPSAPSPSVVVEPVQAAIDTFRIANPHVLSAMGLVQHVDGEVLEGSGGFLDASGSTPIGPDTKISIGSITKTFTATMVLQLMEEGVLDLDAPVAGYLSSPWAEVMDDVSFGGEITVRQALSHRSGIYDYLVSPLQSQFLSNPGRVFTPLEAFQFVASGPPDFPPGTDFKYSNTNFLMLGNVVENLTGQSYVEALESRIVSPVGMGSTFMYYGSSASQRVGIAHSYTTIAGIRFDIMDFSRSGWGWSVGGLTSTTRDLVSFLRALGSGELFDNAMTLEMMTDLGDNTWYGLGVQIDDQPFVGRCFGHGGYSFGSTANVRHCPDAGITFSSFYASDGALLGAHLDINQRILGAVF